ncbi:unnamed protein product, partial [Choristocarpus tenellus]
DQGVLYGLNSQIYTMTASTRGGQSPSWLLRLSVVYCTLCIKVWGVSGRPLLDPMDLEDELPLLRRRHAATTLASGFDEIYSSLHSLREYQEGQLQNKQSDHIRDRTRQQNPLEEDGLFQTAVPDEDISGLSALDLDSDTEKGPLQLDMRINIVLIGFEEGEKSWLNIPHATLELWLEHLKGVLQHVTMAPGGAGSTGDTTIHSLGEVEPLGENSIGGYDHHHASAEVEYSYRFHVVDVGREVLHALEASMRLHLREEEEEEDAYGDGDGDEDNDGEQDRGQHGAGVEGASALSGKQVMEGGVGNKKGDRGGEGGGKEQDANLGAETGIREGGAEGMTEERTENVLLSSG